MTATAMSWLLHTLLGGGLLLLLAWTLLPRIVQPARRQRLGDWAMTAALLLALLSLAPAWLVVTVPAPSMESPTTNLPSVDRSTDLPRVANPGPLVLMFPPHQGEAEPAPGAKAAPPPAPAASEASAAEVPLPPSSVPDTEVGPHLFASLRHAVPEFLLALYILGATLMAAHWIAGHIALAWLLRDSRRAPEWLDRLLREMADDPRRIRLLLSSRVGVPFSYGLWRPTIVLPLALVERGSGAELHWVLSHERTHLERRDAWSCLLFGMGQVFFYVLPWFWSLRRRVRLSQEYVADAMAAGSSPEEYAQFLLCWANAPTLPAGVTGVTGRSSDLFRRVTMLLQSNQPTEKRCPRRWSLSIAAALTAMAILGAGVGLRVATAKDDTKKTKEDGHKPDVKKDDARKDENKDRPGNRFDNLLPELGELPDIKGLDREKMAELRKQVGEMRKQMLREFGGLNLNGIDPFAGHLPMMNHHARLGAVVQKPGATLVDQLDLPKDQGLILEQVTPGSAAAKAGLQAHDILLELNGKTVPSEPAAFVKDLNELKANTPMDAVVLRKGKKETIKGLTLPEKAKVEAPRGFAFPELNLPALPGVRGAVGNGATTSITRNNDGFTINHKQGDVGFVLSGKVEDGKAVPQRIEVTDGGKTTKYASVDKVPENHREQVQKLLKMAETGRVKADVRP
jgi:beta-lactamase regulating signal transducer with metallopeptidase domain